MELDPRIGKGSVPKQRKKTQIGVSIILDRRKVTSFPPQKNNEWKDGNCVTALSLTNGKSKIFSFYSVVCSVPSTGSTINTLKINDSRNSIFSWF